MGWAELAGGGRVTDQVLYLTNDVDTVRVLQHNMFLKLLESRLSTPIVDIKCLQTPRDRS
jgi:hypothetical protein